MPFFVPKFMSETELKAENHIEKVQKRDGRIVDFEQEKITEAITPIKNL